MVHADATNFTQDTSKEDAYKMMLLQAEGLLQGQRNWVCNLSNIASLLWHMFKSLPSPSNQVNWAGFYTLDPAYYGPNQDSLLILAPFHGKPACQTIAFARGVCGTAAQTQTTQLVPNVHAFPGHIACDSESKSEIVVPIISPLTPGGQGNEGSRKLVGIMDIDCTLEGGFDEVDKLYLEKLAVLLADGCDWPGFSVPA